MALAELAGDARLSKLRIIGIAVVTAAAYTAWGMLISLMPPFYPREAERRGAKPEQYGFVFGIYNLTAFIFAPIFGKFGPNIGPRLLYISGGFAQGVSAVLFSLLGYIDNTGLFLGFSYVLRAVAGLANAATWSAVLPILLKLFPSKVSQTIAFTETFFGLGFLLGPVVGSFLYSLGGFLLPYLVVGLAATTVAVGMVFVLPPLRDVTSVSSESEGGAKLRFRNVVGSPSMALPMVDCFVCFLGIGLNNSMLPPYAEKEVGASVTQVAVVFLSLGCAYMVTNPVAGFLCNKFPYGAMGGLIGNVAFLVSFTFLAPLPFVPIKASLWMINVSIVVTGIGTAFINVSAFTRAQRGAVRMGYREDIDTYILISGLFASSMFLGTFIGPTLSGFLVERYEFPSTSLVFWVLFCIMFCLNTANLVYDAMREPRRRGGYESID